MALPFVAFATEKTVVNHLLLKLGQTRYNKLLLLKEPAKGPTSDSKEEMRFPGIAARGVLYCVSEGRIIATIAVLMVSGRN